MSKLYAGIDIGGTKTAFGIFDEQHELIAKSKFPSNKDLLAEEFFLEVIKGLEDILNKNGFTLDSLSGIGMGIPGMVNGEDGEIVLIAMLPSLNSFNVRDFIHSKLPNVEVKLGNDSHCAALAEYRCGAGRGTRHMIYCPVSTGLSSGIIIDGKLFTGSNGVAGESGHTIVTPDKGIACGCKNQGCVQSYSSGGMIVRHIKDWISSGEETLMLELAGSADDITARHIKEAYEKGDKMAEKALDQMAKYLGIWIFNLYLTLNIDTFVFGGGLINLGDILFGRIRKVFDSYRQTDMPVYFKFAELSQDSGIIGAFELLF